MSESSTDTVTLIVDGRTVEVTSTASLLDVLRDEVGVHSVKDGCAPQGQCGCCTVLVDGAPRVACVTPVRRVAGRTITTVEAVPDAAIWAEAFCATGASQCGFCTPGIIVRLAGLEAKKPDANHDDVEQALLAHVCRCTGWRTILDAWDVRHGAEPAVASGDRDLAAAAARAELEGGAPQSVSAAVAFGHGGFADDTAPSESLVAILDPDGAWTLGQSVAAARDAAGTIQGRRTTADAVAPIDLPDGTWDLMLQTSWVEPGYLETDASWATPGDEPATPLANGGAFGAKVDSAVTAAAAALGAEHAQSVRVRYRREDSVRLGAKRPPMAAGLRFDGTGIVRVARTPGIAAAISRVLPDVVVEEVDIPGPPTAAHLRGAGWVEAEILRLTLTGPHEGWIGPVTTPEGGEASACIDPDGTVRVRVSSGDMLDEVVLRSYVIGAAHQALSWVSSESLTVGPDGVIHDLTVRSFDILRAVDTPPIVVDIVNTIGPAVAVSDAAFAAVAAAIWIHQGLPVAWPTRIPVRSQTTA